MCEIILIILLCRKVSAIVSAKGHSSGLYIFLTVVLWIGGEICGGIIGAVIQMAGTGLDDVGPLVYLFALLGAGTGALIAYTIANNLEPVYEPPRPDQLDWPSDKFRSSGPGGDEIRRP